MRFVYLFLYCVFRVIVRPAWAQSEMISRAGWQELTISDGLSQGMVFDIKQDRKGFIWIATKDGLNRYDGYNFKVYTPDTYNAYSLSEENCSSLFFDRTGRLWVGTLNQGINLLDTHTERFYHLNIQDQTSEKAGNYEIRWIDQDPDGHLWVSTNKNQLFRITLPPALRTNFPTEADFTGQVRIQQFELPDKDLNGRVYHAGFQPGGQGILGTTYGMYQFNWRNPAGFTPVNRITGDVAEWDASGDVSVGGYWFTATTNALHSWYKGVHKAIRFTDSENYPSKILRINAQKVAVFSGNLLWIMSPAALFQQDKLDARNAFSQLPQSYYITSMLADQTGLLWLGTAGYGLRKFNPGVHVFRSYLPGQSLSYLLQDQQKRTYVRQGFYFGQVDFSGNRIDSLEKPPIGLPVQLKHYILQDRIGSFWVLYEDSGIAGNKYKVAQYTKDWKFLKSIPMPPGVLAGAFVGTYALEDKRGKLWFGMANGQILRFDPATDQFQSYSYAQLFTKGGAVIETYFLYLDQAEVFWICTNKGLVRMDTPFQKPRFSVYTKSNTDRNSLSHDVVSCVVDDPYEPARYLWVSTKGGGLNKMEKKTGRFTHISTANGLPNKVVYGMLVDEFRNLWMSTNRGIAQFNPRTKAFHNYTKSDGLQDDEFNTASFVKSASGEMLFGGINGLTVFRPRDIVRTSAKAPTAQIIGLLVNNVPVKPADLTGILQEGITYTQRIDLNHEQNIITLEFGLADYQNPPKNRYRYRLEGINDQWVESGTIRFANYTHLPDGLYTFQMMGSVDGNVWSKPVSLRIRVKPPFYRSWWAYLLYGVLVGATGLLIYRFQSQRLHLQQQVVFEQKEAQRLAELDSLKTQFFANISHEFRTPLTLILGPLSSRKKRPVKEPELSLMERNAQRLLRLINQLLNLAKLEAGQLRPVYEQGDIAVFFRTLTSSFTSLAESRELQFTFGQNQQTQWADFDRDKLEIIVTNLLSNAFKFTPAGKSVRMEVAYPVDSAEHLMYLTIEDTGIGISGDELPRIFDRFYQQSATAANVNIVRSSEGTGIGLALVKELVDVLGGSITVHSSQGVGTAFRVILPLRTIDAPETTPTDVPSPTTTDADGESGNESRDEVPDDTGPGPETSFMQAEGSERPGTRPDNLLLIIDDNADIRAYIRSIFAGEYQILEAVDGQQGLELATVAIPDLVICDLMMPRLDGFGFCRILKSQTATSHIPVVMLTAKATVEDRIEGFELGTDDYLTKPFNQTEIQVRVRNLLDKQRRLQRYFGGGSGAVTQVTDSTPPHASVTKEEQFIERVHQVIDAHIASSKFGMLQLSEAMGMSQSQVVRKLKALTNQTGVEFIRNRRLAVAAERLRLGESVSDVAFQVGFESLSYFTRSFQDKFGVLPSAYLDGQEKV